MIEHVAPEIADYLEGRLDARRMEEIRRHLEDCPDCAADVAWAQELQAEVLAQGLRHISPERIMTLAASNSEPASHDEKEHLAKCAVCQSELEWVNRQSPVENVLSDIETRGGGEVQRQGMQSVWRWAWPSAAVAVAAVAIVLMIPRGGGVIPVRPPVEPPTSSPPSPLASLARIEPLPVRFTRSPVPPGSFEESRLQGLESYEGGDYPAAARYLRRAQELRGENDEIGLYLGSAELLRGDSRTASAILEAVVVHSQDPTILAEALWQLANARLLLGDRAAAVNDLQRLKSLDQTHQGAADTLIAEIRTRP